MNLPRSLKIGGHTVKVVLCELPDGVDGEYDTETNTIKLRKTLSKTQLEATLIHEIFHALNSQFDDEGVMHALLESLSQQFYAVLATNKLNFSE